MMKIFIRKPMIPALLLCAGAMVSVVSAQNVSPEVEEILNVFERQRISAIENAVAPANAAAPPVQEVSQISSQSLESPAAAASQTEAAPSANPATTPDIGINGKIDVLDLKDMDILDFLKFISQKSGLNVVSGPNVRGKITIYLKDVDIKDALKIVLETNDLAYIEDDQLIKVMTAKDFELKYGYKFGDDMQTRIIKLKYTNVLDMVTILNQMKSLTGKVIFDHKSNTLMLIDSPNKLAEMENLIKQIDVPIETEVFDLSYASAKEISEKLAETLTLNIGRIKFDERSNRLVITDTATKIREIEKIIKAFDVKEQEVLIEAKIIQIVLSDEHKMGVDWEAIVSDYHTLDFKSSFSVLSSSDKRGKVSIGTLSNDDYTFLLEALETVGKTNILSNPSITVVNNKEAKILVGSSQPYVTTTTTTPASGPSTTAETVNFIDVGVKLFVTPTIHEDRFITMKIKPEVSTVTSNLKTSNNNTIPIVDTSEAETIVTVKDNVTIVIGGLIKEEKLTTLKKIPLLGDLPFLGIVFRNQEKTLKKTELVIFLTPKIATGDVASTTRLEDLRDKGEFTFSVDPPEE